MLYDANNINLTLLKQYRLDLFTEKNNFQYRTYNTFLSSYLNSSNDIYIKLISSKLDKLYQNINYAYSSLYKWLDMYIENVSALESVLSKDSSSSFISESIIRNYVNSRLSDLPKNKITSRINYNNTNIKNTSDSEEDFVRYVS